MFENRKELLIPDRSEIATAWQVYRNESVLLHKEALYPSVADILSSLGPTKVFVDAGCGDGALTSVALRAARAKYCHAIDSNDALLEMVRSSEHTTLFKKRHDLSLGIPLSPNSVDVILASNLLMHFNEEELHVFLCSMACVLRNSGVGVIVVTHESWVRACYFGPQSQFPIHCSRKWGAHNVAQTYLSNRQLSDAVLRSGLVAVGRVEVPIPDLEGLPTRYASAIGTPVFDILLVIKR
jgi:SAM-dependent methyltransferase